MVLIQLMIKKLLRKIIDKLFSRKLDDIKIQKGLLFEKFLEKNLNRPMEKHMEFLDASHGKTQKRPH